MSFDPEKEAIYNIFDSLEPSVTPIEKQSKITNTEQPQIEFDYNNPTDIFENKQAKIKNTLVSSIPATPNINAFFNEGSIPNYLSNPSVAAQSSSDTSSQENEEIQLSQPYIQITENPEEVIFDPSSSSITSVFPSIINIPSEKNFITAEKQSVLINNRIDFLRLNVSLGPIDTSTISMLLKNPNLKAQSASDFSQIKTSHIRNGKMYDIGIFKIGRLNIKYNFKNDSAYNMLSEDFIRNIMGDMISLLENYIKILIIAGLKRNFSMVPVLNIKTTQNVKENSIELVQRNIAYQKRRYERYFVAGESKPGELFTNPRPSSSLQEFFYFFFVASTSSFADITVEIKNQETGDYQNIQLDMKENPLNRYNFNDLPSLLESETIRVKGNNSNDLILNQNQTLINAKTLVLLLWNDVQKHYQYFNHYRSIVKSDLKNEKNHTILMEKQKNNNDLIFPENFNEALQIERNFVLKQYWNSFMNIKISKKKTQTNNSPEKNTIATIKDNDFSSKYFSFQNHYPTSDEISQSTRLFENTFFNPKTFIYTTLKKNTLITRNFWPLLDGELSFSYFSSKINSKNENNQNILSKQDRSSCLIDQFRLIQTSIAQQNSVLLSENIEFAKDDVLDFVQPGYWEKRR